MPEIRLRGGEFDGLALRYTVEGRGPAVILLHGLGGFAETWRHNTDALAARATVYALDLPGFGRSAKPRASYRLPFYARVLAAFTDALGLGRKVHAPQAALGHLLAERRRHPARHPQEPRALAEPPLQLAPILPQLARIPQRLDRSRMGLGPLRALLRRGIAPSRGRMTEALARFGVIRQVAGRSRMAQDPAARAHRARQTAAVSAEGRRRDRLPCPRSRDPDRQSPRASQTRP